MTELLFYRIVLLAWLALALASGVALFFRAAPYGRYSEPGWGRTVPARIGWMVMEGPAALVMIVLYAIGERRGELVPSLFLALWLLHYLYRAFLYPLRIPAAARRLPLGMLGMGILFNAVNAYLNGRILFTLGPDYPRLWLTLPHFWVGLALFLGGFAVHVAADSSLLRLRAGGYAVPGGRLFRRISCPNYFGEIVQWLGWALATWTLAGFAFALWTTLNLLPRALRHHRWYRHTFPEYPRRRRAVIPFLL